jgi:hypothetical protein
MRYRKLRIAWSVVCGIGCVLLIVLWMRSYWYAEVIKYPLLGQWDISGIGTMRGALVIVVMTDARPANPKREYRLLPVRETMPITWTPRRIPSNYRIEFLIPIWLIVLPLSVLSAAPWIKWRFTLRTLLIATTLVALVLGLIVAVLRWPAG